MADLTNDDLLNELNSIPTTEKKKKKKAKKAAEPARQIKFRKFSLRSFHKLLKISIKNTPSFKKFSARILKSTACF